MDAAGFDLSREGHLPQEIEVVGFAEFNSHGGLGFRRFRWGLASGISPVILNISLFFLKAKVIVIFLVLFYFDLGQDMIDKFAFEFSTSVCKLFLASDQTILNKWFFLFRFAIFFLFVDQKGIPIFECVFCSSLKGVNNFRPLLLAVVVSDQLQQLDILIKFPRSFFEVGVEVAVPVFPALFGASEDLVGKGVASVQFLWDHLPVEDVGVHVGPGQLFLNYFPEHVGFEIHPVFYREVGFSDAEPFEHAVAGVYSWNQNCDLVPVILGQIFL